MLSADSTVVRGISEGKVSHSAICKDFDIPISGINKTKSEQQGASEITQLRQQQHSKEFSLFISPLNVLFLWCF